ncbi:MAG: MBL fold metallo-hydrolase [Curvibacter sp.]
MRSAQPLPANPLGLFGLAFLPYSLSYANDYGGAFTGTVHPIATFLTGDSMIRRLLSATLTLVALSANAAPTTVHLHTSSPDGFLTNSVWIDDGTEVTVIDTQFTPRLAEALVADIAKQTRSPIRRVIVTHPSPDKFNALSVFHRLGATSIASQATAAAMPGVHRYKQYYWVNIAKAFTAETYPQLELPSTTFVTELVVPLKNGDQLTLKTLATPGVTSTQTVVRIDSTGDLVVGDLVANRTHAWLEGAVESGKPAFDLKGWQASLRSLPALAKGKARARLFAGRGPALPVAEAVKAQLNYLDTADKAIAAQEVAAADPSVLRDAARQGPYVEAVQQSLVRAFPGYAQPELVGYSLYGWLSSRSR